MSDILESILKITNFRIKTTSNGGNIKNRNKQFCHPTSVAALWGVDVWGILFSCGGEGGGGAWGERHSARGTVAGACGRSRSGRSSMPIP